MTYLMNDRVANWVTDRIKSGTGTQGDKITIKRILEVALFFEAMWGHCQGITYLEERVNDLNDDQLNTILEMILQFEESPSPEKVRIEGLRKAVDTLVDNILSGDVQKVLKKWQPLLKS